MIRRELHIPSMHCEQCAASVERYLRNRPGVEAAEVDFEAERGEIEVAPGTDVDGLVEALDAIGYGASLVD